MDPASRLLIHTDSGQGRIILHSLISGNQKTVFQSNFSQPSHLALDTTNGYVHLKVNIGMLFNVLSV